MPQIDKLKALGLTVFVSQPNTMAHVAQQLEQLGRMAGSEQIAKPAAERFRQRLAALQTAAPVQGFTNSDGARQSIVARTAENRFNPRQTHHRTAETCRTRQVRDNPGRSSQADAGQVEAISRTRCPVDAHTVCKANEGIRPGVAGNTLDPEQGIDQGTVANQGIDCGRRAQSDLTEGVKPGTNHG